VTKNSYKKLLMSFQFSVLFTLLAVFMLPACAIKPDIDKKMSAEEASTFYAYVSDRVRREYVEPVDNLKLLEGALNGMLTNLDPHSAYLNPEKFEEINKQTQGRYAGVGLEILVEEGIIKVVSPIEDSPAYKAGIQSNDLIIMIDKEPVFGLSSIEAAKKMWGEPGTAVTLSIRRKDQTAFDVTIKRDIIITKPVKSRIEESNIGYLRLTTFSESSGNDLKKAIVDLQNKLGSKLLGFVLDLRNNAGGLFDSAIEVADIFLNDVEIVSIRGREQKNIIQRNAIKGDLTNGLPLVVLINEGSASSSEIVAGALQDHKRAIIVGTKSWGKGSVQTVYPLTNGGAIKLTTALFYTPSGRSIQKQGIEPDIQVEQKSDLKSLAQDQPFNESSLAKAISTKEPLDKDQSSPQKPDSNQKDESKIIVDNTSLKNVEDFQLLQALNILKAGSLYGGHIKPLKKAS
jgi:carboxyl-terminal processing protease